METQKLENEIREFCLQNYNEKQVQKYTRFFVEGYDAYGLDQKLMESQRDLWLKEYREPFGLQGFLQLGDKLVRTGKYEEASFALWFVNSFSKDFDLQTFEHLGIWMDDGLRNWAHTDMISLDIFSQFLLREIASLDDLASWRAADSKWKRRAVPVSLIKYMQKIDHVDDILSFLSPMMMDPEKVVRQGLGWFLREAWKKFPAQVEAYLLLWKDQCGRLIIQYATEKMSSEQKALFKRNQK
ncbi:MAG: DNA alkylation repair protein [Anaerolineaceae bacterium]|nr:DNA alkylation repair protein [Anaerolineaceae bacterium]